MRRLQALAGLLVLGVVLTACGSDSAVSLGPAPQRTVTVVVEAAPPGSISFQVWLERGERLVAVRRVQARTRRVAAAALQALLAGPTRRERASGITTAIPDGTRLLAVAIKAGVATLDLTSD